MGVLLVLLAVLIVGLLAQALFDSAIGAWAAVAAVFAIVVLKLVAWLGVFGAGGPDMIDGGD